MQLRGSMFLSCQKSAKLVSLWAPLHTPDGLTQPELFFAGRQSIQIQGISSMTSTRLHSFCEQILASSIPLGFAFGSKSLVFFALLGPSSFATCGFARLCDVLSLPNVPAFFSTHSHLARSAFKAKSFPGQSVFSREFLGRNS